MPAKKKIDKRTEQEIILDQYLKDQNISHTVTHVRAPLNQKSDKFGESSDYWLFIVNGVTFDFYTGVGHRVFKKAPRFEGHRQLDSREWGNLKYSNLTGYGFKLWIHFSKPTPPELRDLFYSLAMDSECLDYIFSEWCDMLGYDVDSISAKKTYEACIENSIKVKNMGINLDELRELYQDY